jgi:hypothetical protein
MGERDYMEMWAGNMGIREGSRIRRTRTKGADVIKKSDGQSYSREAVEKVASTT